jgi:hypothetical protein
MNKKIASSKRLQLNKETLRSLTGEQLSQVQGASGACAIAVGGGSVFGGLSNNLQNPCGTPIEPVGVASMPYMGCGGSIFGGGFDPAAGGH